MVKKPASSDPATGEFAEFPLLEDEDRTAMLALAGTVSLPPPYPQIADFKLSSDKKSLEISVVRAPYEVTQFTVQVDDVRALYIATDPVSRFERANLCTGDPITALAKGQTGIAFVRGDATVLVAHSFADTAWEVSKHYPIRWGTCDYRPCG